MGRRGRWGLVLGSGLALVAASCVGADARDGLDPVALEPVAPGRLAPSSAALDSLDLLAQVELERAIAAADARYAPEEIDGAVSLGGRLEARIDEMGAHLELGSAGATLRVTAIGRGAASELADGAPSVHGAEVHLPRSASVTEWWRALPSGLEHGVTLAERPRGDGRLDVTVSVEGLSARTLDERSVELLDAGGARLATYGNLLVVDADGSLVPARMIADEGTITVAIEDADARYPLIVDPIVVAEEAALVPRQNDTTTGYSVAIASDGSRVVVGVPGDTVGNDLGTGTARVFARSGTTWVPEATFDGVSADDRFGTAVAMSGDGARVLVGAPGVDNGVIVDQGRAYAFVRGGSTWVAAGTPLQGALGDVLAGESVALSEDGTMALVGSPDLSTRTGSVMVFTWNGSRYLPNTELPATALAAGDSFGISCALSADGSRAVVGADGDDGGNGTVRVFLRSGAVWAEEAIIAGTSGGSTEALGRAVAMSGDGTRVLAGAPSYRVVAGFGGGRAQVYLRTGTAWAFEADLAVGTTALEGVGRHVALSSDGLHALVTGGGTRAFARSGTVWTAETAPMAGGSPAVALSADGGRAVSSADIARVFTRSGSTWAEEAWLAQFLGQAGDAAGASVAVAADASRAVVGVPGDDPAAAGNRGSARIFVRSGSGWSEEASLVAPSGTSAGRSVATTAAADRVLVGGTDAARVYARAGAAWSAEAALVPGGTATGFGASVSITGDGFRAIVGAPTSGNARVFLRSGASWAEEAPLAPADFMAGDAFGGSVAICRDGTRAIVGAPGDDTVAGTNAGSVRIYVRTGTTWAEEAQLFGPGAAATDAFGTSVALTADGSRAIVGSETDDNAGGIDAGSAHVFSRSGTTWSLEATLTASGPAAYDLFGHAVSFADVGSRVLVSAPNDDTVAGGANAGTVRVFVRVGTTWAEEATLVATGGAASDTFGQALAVASDASRAIVGVPGDDTPAGLNPGSARVHTILPDDPNGTACVEDWTCRSGACVDGFCCDGACGGDVTNDCQACAAALTGLSNGTCGALTAASAPTITCRPAATMCDVAEVCEAGSTSCPTDDFAAPTVVCRAAATACDAAESCTGASAECPIDAPALGGTVCRATAGACDPTEACDGASFVCPADVVSPNGTLCGGVGGTCSSPGTCNGVSPVCPGATPRPAGTVCQVAMAGNPCDVDDVCDGVTDACAPRFASATTSCGTLPSGACDAVDHCAGTSADCIPTFVLGGTECRAAAGPCDVAEVCSGAATACPPNGFDAPGISCRSRAGACDLEETCTGTMAACPTDLRADASTVCRPNAGGCDRPESCDGFAVACPPDQIGFPGAVCRPAAGGCDLAETCSGLDTACPADALAATGTSCRGALGACDVAEVCTGTDGACPADVVLASATVCRASAGACDPAEACDGLSGACPGDVLSPSGTGCGGTTVGSCSSPGVCSGTSASCPGVTPRPAGTVCLPSTPGDPCDVDDVCDGTTDVCAAAFAPSTTPCGPGTSDVCDAPDHCSGTSADCVAEFVAGVECRPAAGPCDVAEVCTGASASCPPEGLLAAGVSCRASTDTTCDPEEMCDGTSTTCPGDVTMCAPDAGGVIDGGGIDGGGVDGGSADGGGADGGSADGGGVPLDAGGGLDAPSGVDAGPPLPVAVAGCSCRTSQRLVSAGPIVVLATLTLAGVRRRRRARR